MHHKHMFSEIQNENCFSTEAHRGFVLDSKQKIKTQFQTMKNLLRIVSKRLQNDIE